MDLRVNILRSSPTFADLSEQELADVARLGTERHLKAGQFIFMEDTVLDYLYVVVKGRIKILRHSASGRAFISTFRGPGDALGNLALVSGQPNPFGAQAVLDTELLAIKSSDFLSYLSARPELGFRVLRRMFSVHGTRLTVDVKHLAELATENADHRVVHTLLTLSLPFGLTLPFTREEVAQMAGTTTETAVRSVNRLRKMGAIGLLRRNIIILDKAKLQSLIGELPQEVE